MASINELSFDQQKLIDILFWEEDEETIELINQKLKAIRGSAEQKVAYLIGVMLELRAISEAREDAYRRTKKRLETARNAEARIRNFITQTMLQFDIKKVDGDLAGVTVCLGKEKLVYSESFDVTELPDNAYMTKVEYKPIAVEIMNLLKAGQEIDGVAIVKEPYIRLT